MAEQSRICSSAASQRVHLLAVLVAVASVCLATATHHPLHCTKWQSNCQKYDQYCSSEKRAWKSCCEPLTYEFSGESSDGSRLRALSTDIYSVKTGTYSTAMAWCDMATDGGGWMVILRRADGEESFERYYDEYEDGFGDLGRDFFYGLRALHTITSRDRHELRIDFYEKANDTESTSHGYYSSFRLESGDQKYKLHLGNFIGSDENLLDNLRMFNSRPFIAKDRINNNHPSCVRGNSRGGWWYLEEEDKCRGDNEPGAVLTVPYRLLFWHDAQAPSLKRTFAKYEVKIRQKHCLESETSSSSL